MRAVDDIETVERRLRAFGKRSARVISHQRATERYRVRPKIRTAAERCLECRNVIGGRGFARDLIVIYYRTLSGRDLGHCVGEVLTLAFIGLDDRALRPRAH